MALPLLSGAPQLRVTFAGTTPFGVAATVRVGATGAAAIRMLFEKWSLPAPWLFIAAT